MECGDEREAQEEGDICTHLADSLRRAAETNTVKQLYPNNKKAMLWIPALSVDPLCACAQSRRVQFCGRLWTAACWALLSMGFSRQEY